MAVAIVLAGIAVILGPAFFATVGADVPAGQLWLAQSNARTAIVQLLVGSGAILGALYAARSFRATREHQQNERFASAVNNLAETSLVARIGGIHSLYLLAGERGDLWDIIDELLVAFIRQRMAEHTGETPAQPNIADVQAALAALGRRDRTAASPAPRPIDLSGLPLRGVLFDGAQLRRVNLSGAVLSECSMTDCSLIEGNLSGANMVRANLAGADLRHSDLTNVDLTGADLYDAKLDGADLSGAVTTGANLRGTHGYHP